MPKPTELKNRKSLRKKGRDYTAAGCYFVTMNTHKNRALFGAIVNGQMILNEAGRVAEEEWHKSASIRKNIKLDKFVVMPNHVLAHCDRLVVGHLNPGGMLACILSEADPGLEMLYL